MLGLPQNAVLSGNLGYTIQSDHQSLYDRLIAAGKPKMVALAAAMRKLLILAYGVLKSNQPFNSAHANA